MRTAVAIACVLSVSAGITGEASRQDADDPSRKTSASATLMIDRFLSSGMPPLTSCKARRTLTASTMGGRLRASMQAWTYLEPDGRFHFDVIRQDGSELIVEHVLVAALEAEQRNQNGHERSQTELTAVNYEFQVNDDTREDGLLSIRLFPRRKTPMLLDGTVIVTPHDGDIVRIQGSPAKPPSWWTTRVDIVRHYARIAGVRVPVEMSSRAKVRIAGEATFSMTYDYMMINGQAVGNGLVDARSR